MDAQNQAFPTTPVSSETPQNQRSNVNDSKAKHTRGRRGKASAKKHDEGFRDRAGQQFTKNSIKPHIKESTYFDEFVLVEQIKSLAIDNVPITCQIPITTNGFALLVNLAYNSLQNLTKFQPKISKNALYRLTLAQFQLRMIQNSAQQRGVASARMESQVLDVPFLNFDQLVMAHPATLKVLSATINVVGNIEYEGCEYRPVVLSSRNFYDEEFYVEEYDEASPSKRLKRERRVTPGPDPYVVTFSNLRDTVVALADPTSSAQARRFFRDHDSLPGAIWNDDVLVNPDEIMPANYGKSHLVRDFECLEAQLSGMHGKFSYLIGEVAYNGKGSPSLFTSSHLDVDRITTFEVDRISEVSGVHRSSRKIHTNEMAVGVLGLLGQYPRYTRPESLLDYSFRAPCNSTQLYPLDWHTLVTSVMRRKE